MKVRVFIELDTAAKTMHLWMRDFAEPKKIPSPRKNALKLKIEDSSVDSLMGTIQGALGLLCSNCHSEDWVDLIERDLDHEFAECRDRPAPHVEGSRDE